VAISQAKI